MSQSQKKHSVILTPSQSELLKFLLPKERANNPSHRKVTLHSIARRALDIGLDMMQKNN
ncbi:hypothetical protein [Proteus mirabilis]|uniref:hypothetical protein n=1 Tax=Proteus mirabilis TaxID=584 RepID=UPI0018C815BB|nr:hypothetical protein [Proteus mirabilis]EKU0463252.1 hypothetical protein [Proteus mirabilis]EKU8089781.1 hypothetical protein [Proteus mirabilis]EKX3824594.1 hypothetical protein [Proteus mirabilis]EKX3828514.1 hypothetical protein [Proteus mirabilis]EKX3836807.1 hypothetical protein [Proteus mirabilis]